MMKADHNNTLVIQYLWVEETKGKSSTLKPEVKDNTVVMFNTIETTEEEKERMVGYFKKNIDSFV